MRIQDLAEMDVKEMVQQVGASAPSLGGGTVRHVSRDAASELEQLGGAYGGRWLRKLSRCPGAASCGWYKHHGQCPSCS
jgi:hypothetical protein